MGILNKEKDKNNAPGKHPGNIQGKVHLLLFSIKGAGLEKKLRKFKRCWNLVTTIQIYVPVWGYWTSIAKEVFLSKPAPAVVSRVFPGCSQARFFSLLRCKKSPQLLPKIFFLNSLL